MNMREQFEKWALENDKDITKVEGCIYLNVYTSAFWTVWQESRSCIVLPKDEDVYGFDSQVILDMCKSAIDGEHFSTFGLPCSMFQNKEQSENKNPEKSSGEP